MKKLLPDVFISEIQFKHIILYLEQKLVNKALFCYLAGGEHGNPGFNLPICVFSRN